MLLAPGALDRVPAEVERLGLERVLLVGTRSAAGALGRLSDGLGDRVVATVGTVAVHVPAEIAATTTDLARRAGADCAVSVGGGSAIGLAKAVAFEIALPIVAVPTTYSGSEMTPLWGRTAGGVKEVGRHPSVQPRTVVYDPELCAGMPAGLAAASGMNAMAHCAEALWAAGRTPMTTALACEGLRRLPGGIEAAVADPSSLEAHARNLAGACLAGLALAHAGSGLHHRLCHAIAGSWNLPHAQTHAVLLPHSTALVSAHAPEAMATLADLLGAPDAPAALWDLLTRLPLPRSLAALGLQPEALAEVTRRAIETAAGDPLVPGPEAVAGLVERAFHGRPPSAY
ncbi:MAG TPA: maleylacetate reductase [Candidatus Dormibacteraeota bacterium]|nr:maleylacetate reductase [Candidatus Dormibacteraeota bacterium]